MIQMMMASIGGNAFAQHAYRLRGAAFVRKVTGLAVVGSGFAVIFAHGLQHLTGA